ncbi:site-specific DNA-methyltransferase [Sporomusa sphaeroides]|uniref:site-specific DNA-methyltransferase n=1 Tax=Sporomusa sphaeroides TaxID=47679 RepID=UPI002C919868|nr:site-specific DNA-methyltransferase [Sporomusa sphaeroides]HML33420.1 site-specific DNA-methyltransferase [Sporomusa sphaeroides]
MPILHWLNRDETLKVANIVPFRLLEADHKLSYGDKSDNMIIQGDNLEALKALLPYYKGQVKCIYIDPPYNTKSAFEHYDDNLEHSQWLHTIYPRLEVLREFLREDGSIWVSIDDNEAHYLKVIMDEIFGRKNFVVNVVWEKKYAVANDHKTIAPMHDHILVYRKSEAWQRNLLPRTEDKDKQYRHRDEKGLFRADNYTCGKTADERPNLYYPVIQPNTGEEIWPKKTAVWRYSQDEHNRHIKEGMIYWGKDGKGKVPAFKRYKHLLRNQGVVPQSIWSFEFAGHTDASRKEVREVLGTSSLTNDFLTPKPEKLIQQVLTIATNQDDLVLDSFLGSGTTAAVAHKMGRRYIGIEMGEHAITHVVPRMQKVVDGEQGGISKAATWHGGGGFRFYRLGETVFDEYGHLNPNVKFPALAAHIWFVENKTPYAGKADSPLIGIYEGTAYYLLYNGILGDKRPDSGNVLTSKIMNILPPHDGPKVIYGEASRLGEARLSQLDITFKQTPYDIKVR